MSREQQYLFIGPDIKARQQFIRQHHATFPDSETYHYYAPDLDISSIIALLQSASLFHSHLLVYIHNADKIIDQKSLQRLLSSRFHSHAFLFFLSEEVKVPHSLEKAVLPSNKKIFWELFPERRLAWIIQYVERKGSRIDEEAAQMLIQLVTASPGELAEVLDQLIALQLDCIREEEVDAYIVHSRKETVFSLFFALSRKNLLEVLQVLQTMVMQRNSLLGILFWLQSQYRKLQALARLLGEGMRHDAAFQKLNIRGKNQQAACLRVIDGAVDIDHVLLLCAEADMLLRLQPEREHVLILELLLYHVTQGTQRRLLFMKALRH